MSRICEGDMVTSVSIICSPYCGPHCGCTLWILKCTSRTVITWWICHPVKQISLILWYWFESNNCCNHQLDRNGIQFWSEYLERSAQVITNILLISLTYNRPLIVYSMHVNVISKVGEEFETTFYHFLRINKINSIGPKYSIRKNNASFFVIISRSMETITL